jgi:hypothetical protein
MKLSVAGVILCESATASAGMEECEGGRASVDMMPTSEINDSLLHLPKSRLPSAELYKDVRDLGIIRFGYSKLALPEREADLAPDGSPGPRGRTVLRTYWANVALIRRPEEVKTKCIWITVPRLRTVRQLRQGTDLLRYRTQSGKNVGCVSNGPRGVNFGYIVPSDLGEGQSSSVWARIVFVGSFVLSRF